MGKYDPLREHLERLSHLRLTFAEIERILGATLPPSARKYSAWWANERDGRHVHALSWLDAGNQTQRLDLNAGTVEFAKQGGSP